MSPSSWSSPVVPRVAACVAIVVNVIYIAASLVNNAIRFDSSYNLTVPRNLAHGRGYASDGFIVRSGDTSSLAEVAGLMPFDPAITTGPTVLAPLALGFLGGGDGLWLARVLMCIWYVALLVGLALLGRRLGGPWGMTAGLLSPLLFDPTMGIAYEGLQGPTDVLGEVPVAALVVFATWSVAKRPHVAALLVGMAVLTKLIAFLAAPAIVVAGVLALSHPTASRVVVRFTLMSALVWAPFVTWQAVIFWSLGTQGFRKNAADQWAMFRQGGSGLEGESPALVKARLLADASGLPSVVLLLAMVGVLAVLAGGAIHARGRLRGSLVDLAGHQVAITAIAAIGVVIPWVAWFVLVASPAYPRYAYPALALGGAVVLSLVARTLAPADGGAVARRPIALPFVAVLLAVVGWQVTGTLLAAGDPASTSLADQRAAARALEDASPDNTFAYTGAAALPAGLALIADMTPVEASDAPSRPLFVDWSGFAEIDERCRLPLLHQSDLIVVCEPRP